MEQKKDILVGSVKGGMCVSLYFGFSELHGLVKFCRSLAKIHHICPKNVTFLVNPNISNPFLQFSCYCRSIFSNPGKQALAVPTYFSISRTGLEYMQKFHALLYSELSYAVLGKYDKHL